MEPEAGSNGKQQPRPSASVNVGATELSSVGRALDRRLMPPKTAKEPRRGRETKVRATSDEPAVPAEDQFAGSGWTEGSGNGETIIAETQRLNSKGAERLGTEAAANGRQSPRRAFKRQERRSRGAGFHCIP